MADVVASLRGFPTANGPIDLDLRHGEVVLVRGANGSGKTSVLRSLAGLATPLRPASVLVTGEPPASLPAAQLVQRLHMAFQDPADTLVGLTVAGEFRLRGLPVPPGLHDLQDRDVATLSTGQARKVGLALVTTSPASLLLLDEPAEGLDDAGRQTLVAAVQRQRARGAVLAVDHTGLLAPLATRQVDLSQPNVAASGSLPTPRPGTAIEWPARTVRRGSVQVALPALKLGPGFHVVRGPNASGKSTLLLNLASLLEKASSAGKMPEAADSAIRLLLPRVADLFTHETVEAELAGVPGAWRTRFGLEPILERHPLSLSAGEAQRVGLAKTLGRPALLYLLDEPEAHLDGEGRSALMAALTERIEAGAIVVAATHDAQLLAVAHSAVILGGP